MSGGAPASGEPLPTTLAGEPLPTALLDSPLGGPRFGAGALVGRTVRAWWRNLVPFVLFSVAAYAPMVAASWWAFDGLFSLQPGQPPPAEILRGLPVRMAAFAAAGLFAMLLQVVLAGAISFGTFADLSGRRAGLGEMLRAGARRAFPVLGTGVVMWLGIVAAFFLLLVPGAMLCCAWAVAIPVAVVERPGVFAALARSAALTRGRRWQVLGGFLALFGLLWVVSLVVQVAVMAAAVPLGGGPLLALLASQCASAFLAALPAVGMAVAYHDLRLEKEGVATEEIVRVFS